MLYFGFIQRLDTAFALDKLYHDPDGMIVYERFDLIDALGIDKTVWKRTEVVVHLLLTRCFDRRDGPSVKGVLERDDLVALDLAVDFAIFSRYLDRSFVGFSTTVAKETLHIVSAGLYDLLCREGLRLYIVEVGDMDDLF